jgi:hypothetical protein
MRKIDPLLKKENHKASIKLWRKENRRKLIEYKGGKCEKCGYDKCQQALDFHHLDPNKKKFGLCNTVYSFEKLKQEADKCILLCANCHREEHYKEK